MNRIIILLLLTVCCQQSAFAQGPLTPPGPPAPTMLTLSQVEPRTPITNTTGVVISTSGSYYLTGNITVTNGNGIEIAQADGVTLDLNGFTISSTDPLNSGSGILLYPGMGQHLTDITILNGHITGGVTYGGGNYTGSGFANGITYGRAAPTNVRVINVSISGCLSSGINLGTGNSTVVDSCTVNTVGGVGILASTVIRSTAYQCGSDAVDANITSDCYGYSTGGNGFTVSQTANNCYGYSLTGAGLRANNANNCSGVSSNGVGLSAIQNATGCYGQSNGSIGLGANNANSCSGQSGVFTGLFADQTAIGCSGSSSNGTGVLASIAIGCNGTGSPGLEATIANSCYSSTGDGAIINKYNMP